MRDDAYELIVDAAGLESLAAAVDSAAWHAIDTESNSGFVYEEKLCLLQLNVAGRLWLVDLVAVGGDRDALAPLAPAFESAERTTYLHGGEFDVACLRRDYAIQLAGVWDSQQGASFLGWEKTGYGAVVEQVCGVALSKKYAHYDWGRRPIDPDPLIYALDDVRYLPAVCEELKRQVAAADLEEEVAIANRTVEEATWNGGYREDGFWSIKGAGSLPHAALPVLVALYSWRDEVARKQDRPPGRVINNRLLLTLSRRAPTTTARLRQLGVSGRVLADHGRDLAALVSRVRREPPPVPSRPAGQRAEPEEVRRGERLKAWRRIEAERRGVPQQVVLPARALAHLRRHGSAALDEVPQLGAKRIELYGERLARLCEGRQVRVAG